MLHFNRIVSFPSDHNINLAPEFTARLDSSTFDRLDSPRRTNLYLGNAIRPPSAPPLAANPWPLPGSPTTPAGDGSDKPVETLKGQHRARIYASALTSADAAASLHRQSNEVIACLGLLAGTMLITSCATYAVPLGVILAVSLAVGGVLVYAAGEAVIVARQTRTWDALAKLAAAFDKMGTGTAESDATLLADMTRRRRYFGFVPSDLHQPIREFVERYNAVHGASD